MSITNRLSLFFLAALGMVLAGFSLTLYLLANRHLYHQADHRLNDAMQTLVAAIRDEGMTTMVTPFDEVSVERCVEFGVEFLKIASSDIRDTFLLGSVAATGVRTSRPRRAWS